ncbi:MAG TPA: DUF1934 domain-containing protein [Candidatus Blautia faecavium]|uniref:DUF1934 domain-containing protein n=1 Tax=Candidatus Blautia faecavium TaxID=2838487 RepID=A0A9D2LSQ2_9FIRM|nr:DUF1934 domain-containing protein [Candidatus Blautia faecavium]
MDKEVLIHVSGLHMLLEGEDQGPVELVVPGKYYFKNGSHYLRYEEVLEENSKPTINYVKISPHALEVRKTGLVDVHMVFEHGKKNTAFYSTPFGTIQLGIAATSLEMEESETGIEMKVDYALDMNEEHVADCCLSIQAQSKDAPDFQL